MNKDHIQEPDYSYLDLLNPQQRSAVVYHDGPSLVIAGAGSGKTRVLTYKIVDLLSHGFEPYRILALTFTNSTRDERAHRHCRRSQNRIANMDGHFPLHLPAHTTFTCRPPRFSP